jgi:hypothetical protein
MEELLIAEEIEVIEAKYFIGIDMPSEHKFIIDLSAKIPDDNLDGKANITITTTPPIKIESQLKADYKYVSIMHEGRHVLITAKGYPVGTNEDNTQLNKPADPVFHLRMIMSDNWKSGIANFDYKNSQGEWIKITDATVQRI